MIDSIIKGITKFIVKELTFLWVLFYSLNKNKYKTMKIKILSHIKYIRLFKRKEVYINERNKTEEIVFKRIFQ